ncbi:MAG: secE [Candidatus Saccharibacteria bacterium]|nr:secE [Candidatus Saccharibacteria bacterium]
MAAKKDSTSTVTRIKASSDTPSKKVKAAKVAEPTISASSSRSPFIILRPFVAMGRYFKGAWAELRQVRWPTRGATWSLTGAVLLFTGFFVVMVLLLDAGFKFLFEQILG